MKKLKALIIVLFIVLISGCNQTQPQSSQTIQTAQTQTIQASTSSVTETKQQSEKLDSIRSTKKSDYDFTKLTKVSQYSYDIDDDAVQEDIILYTTAEVNDKGEIIWDDGQNWSLFVEDGEQVYKLFDQYVQLGSAYFEFSEYYMNSGKIPTITLLVSEGAQFYLRNYSYDKANKNFTQELLYTSEDKTDAGISKLFSSMPDVIKASIGDK